MADQLDHLARRVEGDPFFLACPLTLYAQSERLDDAGLAGKLGCTMTTLSQLKLCRAPAREGREFLDDIERIAGHFGISAEVLIEVTRRGQVLQAMQGDGGGRTLMAARDREPDVD